MHQHMNKSNWSAFWSFPLSWCPRQVIAELTQPWLSKLVRGAMSTPALLEFNKASDFQGAIIKAFNIFQIYEKSCFKKCNINNIFEMMWPLFFKLFFKRNFDNDHVMVRRLLVSGSSPTHQPTDISFEIPKSLQTAMPGTSPIHQQVNIRWQNQSPATTHDRSWLCTPVDHHQPWDLQDS